MTLNDADADAFFRQGDEGTYSGGPADSLPVGVVNVFDDLDEGARPRLTREQIERRDRYTRRVKGLISVLGATAVLTLGMRAVQGHDDDGGAASVSAAGKVTTPLSETRRASGENSPPPAEPVVAQGEEPAARAAGAPEPARPELQPSQPEPAPRVVAPPKLETPRVSTPKERTLAPTARAPEPHKSVPVARAAPLPVAPVVPIRSSPPTANFPD